MSRQVAAMIALVLGIMTSGATATEIKRFELRAKAASPGISLWDFDPCAGLVNPPARTAAVDRATATVPQAPAAPNEPKTSPVYSPGTDTADYVPGSTVESFGGWDTFNLGKILIRPSARVSYLYESNLLNVPNSTASADHSFHLEPSIEAFLPVTRNGIRLGYTAAYRNYRNFELSRPLSHVVDADSRFDLTTLVSLSFREHFASSSLDSREYVPGREIVFSDAPFKRNDVAAQLDWTISSSDSLGLNGNWNKVSFDEIAPGTIATGEGGESLSTSPFYDYDHYRTGGFYRREISQRTGLIFSGSYLRDLTRDTRNIANSKGFETLIGIDTALTPLTSGQFSIGYRGESFPGAPQQDFGGVVFRGLLQKEFTENMRISLAGSRSTNPSNFQSNAFYVTTGLGLVYAHELGPRITVTVSPAYQKNSYPELLGAGPGIPGELVDAESRTDHLLELSADARYRQTQWVALELFFDVIHRDSILPEFRFTDYRAGVSLLIGQHGTSRGRIPY
jgi:hypothetical protein